VFSIIAEVLHINRFHNTNISGNVSLPVSKSIANRLLIIKALAGNLEPVTLTKISDIDVLAQNLESKESILNFKDAGTPLRLFVAYAAIKDLRGIVIDGGARLRERPLEGLIHALKCLGAEFEFLEHDNCLPFKLLKGVDINLNRVEVSASVSSQFISAFLLIAPYFNDGLTIVPLGEKRSEPYIDLTIHMMQKFGVAVNRKDNTFIVPHGKYLMSNIQLEADWSAAAFFYNLASISPFTELTLKHLSIDSVQGDKRVKDVYQQLGVNTFASDLGIKLSGHNEVLNHVEVDFKDVPDMFPAVCACLVFHGKTATFKGVKTLRDKESDRIEAMKQNLEQAGGVFEMIDEDTLAIGHSQIRNRSNFYQFKTFSDHRIAMALAIFAFQRDIIIDDETVVEKSFPEFWLEWLKLTQSDAQKISE